MLPSANTLMASGTSLVFKYLAQLQADAAEMEQDNLEIMKSLLNAAPKLLQASLKFADDQAHNQMQSGWVMFGDSMAQAVGSVGTSLIGTKLNPMPDENSPQIEAELTPEEDSPLLREETDGASSRTTTSGEETAQVDGRTSTRNAANKAKVKQTSDDEEKALNKKMEKVLTQRNAWNNVYAPQVANILSSGCKAGNGYVQADATRNQAESQFVSGVSQMLQGVEGQTSANIQSKEQQEQAAMQALISVEQLSASRG